MARVQTLNCNLKEFVSGEWKIPKFNEGMNKYGRLVYNINAASLVFSAVTMGPTVSDDTFNNVWAAIMNIFDWGVCIVIAFAGACWALGHRTKAIEILIGVCAGYLLARHAVDIRNFLRGI